MLAKDRAIKAVIEEFECASKKFTPFNSAHEGLAVIEEEFIELRGEVFWGRKNCQYADEWVERMEKEAIQVAAMALRFLVDIRPKYIEGEEVKLVLALQYDPFAGDRGDLGDRCFKDKIVTFRKEAKCSECLGDILKGDRGRSMTMPWQSDGVTHYRICPYCTKAMARCVETGCFDPLEARMKLREDRGNK